MRPFGIDWTQIAFIDEAPVQLRTRPFRSVLEIKEAVARRYKVKVSDLEGDSRKKAYAHPRQVAMALSYRKLRRFGYSLPVIGKQFGDRDHTTVLHAYRKIGTKGQLRVGQATARTISRPSYIDRRG